MVTVMGTMVVMMTVAWAVAVVMVEGNDILNLDDDGGDSDGHTPANCIVGLGGHRSVMLMMITIR